MNLGTDPDATFRLLRASAAYGIVRHVGDRFDLSAVGRTLLSDSPDSMRSVVLMIGHQPSLGQAISLLLGLQQDSCPVRKGAVWWIRTRERDGDVQTVVVTVQAPELL